MQRMVMIGLVCLGLAAQARGATSLEQAVKANNEFGFELYKQIKKTPDGKQANRLLSPISAFSAVSLVGAGAGGETNEAIRKAISASQMDTAELNQSNRALLTALNSREEVSLALANSVWTRTGFSLLDSFRKDANDYYDAAARELDFSLDSSAKIINDWVAEKTHDKIKELVKAPMEEDFMVINATYFKGSWTQPFIEEQTAPAPFHAAGGPREVATMHSRIETKYVKQEGLEAISMSYGALGEARFLLVLPENLDELEASLNSTKFAAISEGLSSAPTHFVNLSLPKFKFEGTTDLVEPLSALGMGIAFSPMADFFQMTRNPIMLTKALQKTYISLDEKGTEAAAVTVIAGTTSVPVFPEVTLNVDRPFLIAIQDTQTQAILFLGAVSDPKL